MQTHDFGFNFENSYARLPEFFFTYTKPTPVRSPKVIVFNEKFALSLGLNPKALQSEQGTAILAGNQIPEGGTPLAQAYAGHQFGHFTILGDGRALLLGEQILPDGARYDLQLKGSGPTPYSRGGDGRATLGPMLREYLISEAMHALGIPTTRSLAVVTTGEFVRRETPLPGAVLTRIASSHLRVGTFQYGAKRGTKKDLRTLADYAIARHYPNEATGENRYRLFLREVIRSQASLIAKWMLVGFIHGVMNTDNMAISGETIDYGPCAFMDTFDPSTVFSSIDQHGRYAYANQPKIAGWNLARFADTLISLLAANQDKAVEIAQEELEGFSALYDKYYLDGFRSKLGLTGAEAEDKSLMRDLLRLMYEHKADYTNTFLDLTFERSSQEALASSDTFAVWKTRWKERLERNHGNILAAQDLMKNSNPAVIPRNHKVEEALHSAVQAGDYTLFKRLLAVLENPFAHSPEQKEYAKPPAPSSAPYRTFCGT